MAEPNDPKKIKKKPPSTSDILKKIRQKKQAGSTKQTAAPKKTTAKKAVTPKAAKPASQKKPKLSIPKPPSPKIKKIDQTQYDQPVAELDKEDSPAFLSETSEVAHFESIEETQNPTHKPAKKKRKRFISSKVIPKINYQRMKAVIYKRFFLHTIFLCWLAVLCGIVIIWVVKEIERRSLILHGVDSGLIALDKHLPDKARQHFNETLARYKTFRVGFSKNFWFIDGQTELAVMRMALGWSQLNEYEKGIQCFKQVFLHDPFSTQPWMKNDLEQHMIEFIQSPNWDQTELLNLYWYLMKLNPAEWQIGEYYLPLMTEWVGMTLYPVHERFANAYDVVYGVPLQQNAGNTFTIQAEIFYKQITSPGEVVIHEPINFAEDARNRLSWYINQERNCIFFCREKNGEYVLDGIQGIQMNSPYFMNEFERVVDSFDYTNS